MGRIQFRHTFEDIISLENLAEAWREFASGKKKKKDVEMFARGVGDHLVRLERDLAVCSYRHGEYERFVVNDPKRREISKASVRDRIVHRALYRKLYPFFDRTFIADSYSCRRKKGTHRAIQKFGEYVRKVSRNNTRQCWVLKCDIRKFFASIDHRVLFGILRTYISEKKILWLLYRVVGSFNSGVDYVGLPLGNLTSQLLVNIYMNEFDQFVKHELKARYYIRYADDFVFLSESKGELEGFLVRAALYLSEKLRLDLHPDKVSIRTVGSGVDFLGWVHFSDHRVFRSATRRRMLRKMSLGMNKESLNSYQGLLGHGNAHKLKRSLTQ